mgnify:CR=1 FL=1
MQKLTVKKINWKEGEGARGKWSKIGIITEELGDKWLGCFEDKYNSAKLRALAEGSVIEVVVTQNGDFWNFAFPSKTDVVAQQSADHEARILRLEKAVFPPTVAGTDVPYPTGEETGANHAGPDDF